MLTLILAMCTCFGQWDLVNVTQAKTLKEYTGAWSLLYILQPLLDKWDWIPVAYLFPNPCLSVWDLTCLFNVLSRCFLNELSILLLLYFFLYDCGSYYFLCPLFSNSLFFLGLFFLSSNGQNGWFWLQLLDPNLGLCQATLKTQLCRFPLALTLPSLNPQNGVLLDIKTSTMACFLPFSPHLRLCKVSLGLTTPRDIVIRNWLELALGCQLPCVWTSITFEENWEPPDKIDFSPLTKVENKLRARKERICVSPFSLSLVS